MQVVILCGGQGTRIRDVADDIPKPMIPVGGKPILWHIMKSYATYGFSEFVLCLGYKSLAIKRYFLEYGMAGSDFTVDLGEVGNPTVHSTSSNEEWRVTLAETGVESMTGCRVKRIEKYIRGDNFLLTYGDGVADVNIRKLVDFHLQHGKTGTVTAVQPPGRFGEIEIVNRQVLEFSEKPPLSKGRISGGFFVFKRSMFSRLRDDQSLVLEQQPLIQLARDGELMAYEHDGFWHCMDSSRDHQNLNDLWAKGKAPWRIWSEQQRLRIAA